MMGVRVFLETTFKDGAKQTHDPQVLPTPLIRIQ